MDRVRKKRVIECEGYLADIFGLEPTARDYQKIPAKHTGISDACFAALKIKRPYRVVSGAKWPYCKPPNAIARAQYAPIS